MNKHFAAVLIATVAISTLSQCNPAPATPIAPTTTAVLTATLPPSLAPHLVVVSSAADAGLGTLRQALENQQPGDVITFDPGVFPPNAPVKISLLKGLPEIKQGNITLDASNAGVILDGSAAANSGNGLSITSSGNTIRGLQVVNFSDAGIGILGSVQHNVIGGDRSIGSGPLGQGNLVNGNGNFGIGLWDAGTAYNTIQGNYIGVNLNATGVRGHPRDGIHSNGADHNTFTGNVIGGNLTGIYLCCSAQGRNVVKNNMIGTDPSGALHLGNQLGGVVIDRSNHNIIGPANLIAYNEGPGVGFWEQTSGNTVTENAIRDNGQGDPNPAASSQAGVPVPVIFAIDLQAGALTGATCPGCTVEVFSDVGDEGADYEGRTVADEGGAFRFQAASGLTGPHLTATATDLDGSTSAFSTPTNGPRASLELQPGNGHPAYLFMSQPSADLADNRTGASFYGGWLIENYDYAVSDISRLGLKRADLAYGEVEPPIDWSIPEYEIPSDFDAFIDHLGANGVMVNYILHYWDKAGHANGVELAEPRFATDNEVHAYLDYVQFIVRHFRGRIPYYTIWSEPDNCSPPAIKCIRPTDYIELARRTIPVIREEDPEAKVVVAPVVLYFARDYLFTVLRSDVVSQFDVISWHPLYDVAPDVPFFGNYYYDYPSIAQSIKETASANGFKGEYWGTEITWRVEGVSPVPEGQPWAGHTHIQSAKYWARGIVMELGMDLGVGLGGLGANLPAAYRTVRNVDTAMAGARPIALAAKVDTKAERVMSYGFALPDGSRLVAIWTDVAAADEFAGVPATLTISARRRRDLSAVTGSATPAPWSRHPAAWPGTRRWPSARPP